MTPVKIYAIFHMNLAFSSIEQESHADVVKQCYWPLLRLVESGIPLGLEMTAYTLEAIHAADPNWVERFKTLLNEKRCELIASGDSQIIGPLVPADVNRHNLRLGQAYYFDILGIKPTIAYINEQAVSAGLLDIYQDAGFDAVVVEWDNPYSHNPDWRAALLHQPQSLLTASGHSLKVIWNHAIAFQKFQRYAHGELILEDYLQYLDKVIQADCIAFPVYGSDAEVFDFRPGRYNTELKAIHGEWDRIATLFTTVARSDKFVWSTPNALLTTPPNNSALSITNAQHPVSVKKQAKYNITRWGLSGRNDLLLNTYCYRQLHKIRAAPAPQDESWRALCRLWASDLRTHLTEKRYQQLSLPLPTSGTWDITESSPVHTDIRYDENRRRLSIKTADIELILNGNRGLAIERLAFRSHGFQPVMGTLSHGHFDHISYGADFYSNHWLMERFRHRDRVTDLNSVSFKIAEQDGDLVIWTTQSLVSGELRKWYRLKGEKLTTGFMLNNTVRPEASLRLGYVTLLDCHTRAWYQTHLGGDRLETFQLTDDVDHGSPVSSLVSANSALGATEGLIHFGTGELGVKLQWDPAKCSPLPMCSSKKIHHAFLNRLWFSLIEADETLKEGGDLLDFEFCITPCAAPKEIDQ